MDQVIHFSINEPFIKRLTDFIELQYINKGADLRRLAVVFGGKRPFLFLRKELAQRMGKSFFSPQFFSIDELMARIVRAKVAFTDAEDLDNSFLLYQLAKKHTPHILKYREHFSQFLPWAREILSFIDQLDLENVS